MNQSILFPDLQSWNADKQQVIFPVQVEGSTIFCTIGLASLAKLSGKSHLSVENVLNIFDQYRFDIEDIVEKKVKAEIFDEQGHINL